MSILVTGGAGYIGSVCVERLLGLGHEVVVVDNLSTGRREAVESGASFYKGNCGDTDLLDEIFSNYYIHTVMHFAADKDGSVSMYSPREFFHNNLINSIRLIDSMLGNGCDRIVFSSSASIFGEAQYLPVDEKHPMVPTSPYGDSKLFFEKVLERYNVAYGLKFVSLRYFNAAGATNKHGSTKSSAFIPIAVRAALDNKTLKVFGNDYDTRDGTCIRDYVHVSDLVNAHILAIDKEGKYNLGSGVGFSNLDVIGSVERVSGIKVRYEVTPRRDGDIVSSVASCELAKRELGWEPQHTINDIVLSELLWQI